MPSAYSGRMSDEHSYWQSAAEDEAMQEEHLFVWEAIVEAVESELPGQSVLDVGCNRGGFLRMLYDRGSIGAGFGYDLAAAAIADARRLAGARPLQFEVAGDVPDGWDRFDLAFSHEVLYLLPDLRAHAQSVYRALVPGGSYYAVMGVHATSPLMVEWHRDHADELSVPPLYDVDDVVASFAAVGFAVAASRLHLGFVPLSTHTSRVLEWLDYYHEKKLLFRFTRPSA
jgi:SAM-dependent methyltransferase